jgi:hypothetical protein
MCMLYLIVSFKAPGFISKKFIYLALVLEEPETAMNVCAEVDCDRKNIFFREALRWVKQTLKDAGRAFRHL